MWDLPRPGLEPVSPALAGGFLTTVLPGKPDITNIFINFNVKLLVPRDIEIYFLYVDLVSAY